MPLAAPTLNTFYEEKSGWAKRKYCIQGPDVLRSGKKGGGGSISKTHLETDSPEAYSSNEIDVPGEEPEDAPF